MNTPVLVKDVQVGDVLVGKVHGTVTHVGYPNPQSWTRKLDTTEGSWVCRGTGKLEKLVVD